MHKQVLKGCFTLTTSRSVHHLEVGWRKDQTNLSVSSVLIQQRTSDVNEHLKKPPNEPNLACISLSTDFQPPSRGRHPHISNTVSRWQAEPQQRCLKMDQYFIPPDLGGSNRQSRRQKLRQSQKCFLGGNSGCEERQNRYLKLRHGDILLFSLSR